MVFEVSLGSNFFNMLRNDQKRELLMGYSPKKSRSTQQQNIGISWNSMEFNQRWDFEMHLRTCDHSHREVVAGHA